MDQLLKIYVDQLKDGHIEKINVSSPPNFLGIEEEDLRFEKTVDIKGEAYLAEDVLMLHLNIATFATIPCAICNSPVDAAIKIHGLYHAVPLGDITSKVYDLHDVIRENILLETPTFIECSLEGCPERKDLEKYFKKPSSTNNHHDADEQDGYQPFKGLTLE